MRKIVILGPESTGKSTLSNQLADYYNTTWVEEYAREYLDAIEREYNQDDLLEIAKGQIDLEEKVAAKAQEFLFCDTNLIVIKVWSDHKYGITHDWIEKNLKDRVYDFYLLTQIDLPWEPDPQREHPHMREYFFSVYREYLEKNHLPYGIVTGTDEERLHKSVDLLNNYFRN